MPLCVYLAMSSCVSERMTVILSAFERAPHKWQDTHSTQVRVQCLCARTWTVKVVFFVSSYTFHRDCEDAFGGKNYQVALTA